MGGPTCHLLGVRYAHLTPLLVVVADLNLVGITILEHETDAPLCVHRNRMLALPVAREGMESITWWYRKVSKHRRCIELTQFTQDPIPDVGWKPA